MSAQLSRDDWKSRIGGLSYRNQAFIGGKFAASLTRRDLRLRQSGDRPGPAEVAAGDAADVDRAVRSARAAFEAGVWSRRRRRSASTSCSSWRR